MLLTLTLTPDKDEIVRPLNTVEFSRLAVRASAAGKSSVGSLIGMDMSGIMDVLDCNEDEAYRICMLLNRAMPLSYSLEKFSSDGVEILTRYNEEYPERFTEKLGQNAPAAFYLCGNPQVLSVPLVAIMGISGVKLPVNAEQQVRALAKQAADNGYGIISGGEPGIARLAALAANDLGIPYVDIVGGDLSTHCATAPIKGMIKEGRERPWDPLCRHRWRRFERPLRHRAHQGHDQGRPLRRDEHDPSQRAVHGGACHLPLQADLRAEQRGVYLQHGRQAR